MTAVLAAAATGGLGFLVGGLIAAFAVPRMRSRTAREQGGPELEEAARQIQAQIDHARSGILR